MIKYQFVLAWRNLVKRRFYSLVEITGLALGMACFIIVLIHVRKELNYDRMFTDYRNIYRILNLEAGSGNRYSGGASAIGFHARQDVPQVANVVRVFFPYRMFSSSALVRFGDKHFYEDNIIEADSNFFELFDFAFVEGNARTALLHRDAVVLSRRAAQKYFGNEPATGQLITIDESQALMVTGVVDVPDNTHLSFDFLRPAHHQPQQLYVWEHTLAFTYLLIPNANDVPEVERQLYGIVQKHATNQNAEYLINYHHQLQPLADIHTTVLQWDIVTATSARQLWSILIIAVFVLLLAVVNFINLATARSSERIKETGINKILGATQPRLAMQFFAEFFLVTVCAGLLAVALAAWFIGPFNAVMNTSLTLRNLTDPFMVALILSIVVLVSLLSGVYPAYRLSMFKPTQVIKRAFTSGSGQHRLRQVLVVFQFTIAIALLSGTLIVQRQITFMQQADLGFDKEHVYVLRLREADRTRFEQLKQAVINESTITHVAGASALLGGEPGSETFHPDHMPDQTPDTFAKNMAVDAGFINLLGVTMLGGRNFNEDNPQDYYTAFIINETAVKQFQLTDPVGINFKRSGETDGKVIGVMKDFHFAKMNDRINPMVFFLDSVRAHRYMYIKMTGNISAGVGAVEKAWSRIMPDTPMEGFFQDQYFNALYKQEQQVARMTGWFSMVAIVLASLGLLAMSSFVILQRTREIGIRKIVGASVADVLVLLSGNFFKLLLVSFCISIPLTIYLVDQWLQGFVVRATISAWFFVVAGGITLFTAAATIGVQAVRAALANPVNALRQD